MTVYIINYLLCSVLLYVPYKLWIAQTSMHHFKRFYLLLVLILPFIIPKLEYNIHAKTEAESLILPNVEYVQSEQDIDDSKTVKILDATQPVPNPIDLLDVIITAYMTFSLFMFIRFLKNLHYLIYQIRRNKKIKAENYWVVQSDKVQNPYSFFHYVFVNSIAYKDGIPQAVWKHEEAHVRQWHSIDIVFTEIITLFCWFNPVIYLLKPAMQLNHELLADQYVLRADTSFKDYGYLLLNLNHADIENNFISQLHYKQLKNRLIMMNLKTSLSKKITMLGVGILAGSIALLAFTKKNIVFAEMQSNGSIAKDKTVQLDTTSIKNHGAPAKLLAEYDSVIRAITTVQKNSAGKTFTSRNLNGVDVKRMAFIASLMSEQQLKERTGEHGYNSPKSWAAFVTKPQKRTPSEKEFSNWQNKKIFGVWIDGKRSSNEDLLKYKNTDIVLYYVSKLHGKAKIGRSYTHQLDVYTLSGYNKAFANYTEEHIPEIKKP